jgi:uncharacterized integral membrane protein (TIGR00698 family)
MPHLSTATLLAQLPGLAVAGAGVVLAVLAHWLVDAIGVLMWAVLFGALATNLGLLPERTGPGLQVAAKRLLRVGIVLLGLVLPVATIAGLGLPVIAMIVLTLLGTLLATLWIGLRVGLGRPRSLLLATGFAICGASAVAAVQEISDADEDDVATAIAMVTLCGTAALIALPLLQLPLGLGDEQVGAWAGASVHEVGQVVAAAAPAGAAAVAVAVVIKLTRVLLLAPVVAALGLLRRRSRARGGSRPPLVPLFLVGFLMCVGLRSLGLVPAPVGTVLAHVQTLALGAAMFALGAGVHLGHLARTGGRALAVGVVSTLIVAGGSLPWVLWLVPA